MQEERRQRASAHRPQGTRQPPDSFATSVCRSIRAFRYRQHTFGWNPLASLFEELVDRFEQLAAPTLVRTLETTIGAVFLGRRGIARFESDRQNDRRC